MTADVVTLTRLINSEVIRAMGLPPEGWAGQRIQPLLCGATRRFSEMFAAADEMIAREGIVRAARWLLLRLVENYRARGVLNVPPRGPVVIAANHPGAADSLAIGATAGRDDLLIMASDVAFLKNLTEIGRHLIFLPRESIQGRMLAVRQAIRHLREGGALLLFAHGTIDPDPAFMPEAEKELSTWSRSLGIFLREVPETRVVTSIVSHVLEPAYMHHPLTWLQRKRVDRQRLAIMIQVIQQMLGKQLALVPHVSFGEAIDGPAVRGAEDSVRAVVETAKRLLRTHLTWET